MNPWKRKTKREKERKKTSFLTDVFRVFFSFLFFFCSRESKRVHENKRKKNNPEERKLTRNAGSAVNKDKDHATKRPSNAQNANTTAWVTPGSLALVADDCQHRNVKEEQRGNELRNQSPVEGPLSELNWVEQRRRRRVMIVLGGEGPMLRNLNVLSHKCYSRKTPGKEKS